MRPSRILAAVFLLLVLAAAVATADLRVPPAPDRRINDYAGALTPPERDRLEQQLVERSGALATRSSRLFRSSTGRARGLLDPARQGSAIGGWKCLETAYLPCLLAAGRCDRVGTARADADGWGACDSPRRGVPTLARATFPGTGVVIGAGLTRRRGPPVDVRSRGARGAHPLLVFAAPLVVVLAYARGVPYFFRSRRPLRMDRHFPGGAPFVRRVLTWRRRRTRGSGSSGGFSAARQSASGAAEV